MRRHPLAIALAAGSLLALSAPAPAQPAPFPTTRDRIPVISLNFPGGTVEKYIAALRDAAGTQGANIVVSKAALGVELAPIQLTGAQLPAAVQALRAAAGVEAGSWDIQEVPGTSNGQGVVMTVDFRAPKASRQSRDDSDLQRLEIISIKQIVEALPGDPPGANIECRPEVVLSAVEAAVSLGQQKAEGEPEVKYHPDSGLLIVRAGPTTMRAAIEAVSAIRDDVKRRRELAHSFAVSPTAMIEAEAAFKRAEAQYRTARDQTEAARDRYPRRGGPGPAGAGLDPRHGGRAGGGGRRRGRRAPRDDRAGAGG